jgi:hypothetical protein
MELKYKDSSQLSRENLSSDGSFFAESGAIFCCISVTLDLSYVEGTVTFQFKSLTETAMEAASNQTS